MSEERGGAVVNPAIDRVAEIAVAANERFTRKHGNAATSVGVISSTIREMGIAADAVNIDCEHSGKRLVLILLDQDPDRVGVGIGQKETVGNYELIRQLPVSELREQEIFDILESRFARDPQ